MHPRILGFRHIALSVRNVQISVDFYCTVLGMKVEWKPDEENVYLTSGADNLAIHKLPEDVVPGPAQSVHHIGFMVAGREDVDAMADQIQRLGIPFEHAVKTHRDGSRSFYFRDPDGILIQLLSPPDAGRGGHE